MKDIYQIQHPERIPSPGLIIFRDLVEKNLQTMISIAGGAERLRPHVKTHKMPEIVQLQMDSGINKFKAATFAEAEMLAECGAKDIFLAYNLVGPNIGRGVAFRLRYPDVKFSVTADDPQMLFALADELTKAETSIGVVLDVNPGRDRTGLTIGDDATTLYWQIQESPCLQPAGLHLYDGHLKESDLAARRQAVLKFWQQITEFRRLLEQQGLSVPRITCGGTPTFPVYAALNDPIIELSPGTCVFHDAGYGDAFPDLNVFTPAALVLTRVVSRPTKNRVTFDLGTKAIASDPPLGQRAVLPDLADGVQVLQNEEHLVVETDHADQWQPGDWTLAIPRHVCPTSALYRSATVISAGEIVEEWNVIARDRKLTI